jgi:hypothetical protein
MFWTLYLACNFDASMRLLIPHSAKLLDDEEFSKYKYNKRRLNPCEKSVSRVALK